MDNNLSSHRKFLHDLASPLAGLKLTVNRLYAAFGEGKATMTPEQLADRLKRCSEFVELMEKIHADYKEHISKTEKAA